MTKTCAKISLMIASVGLSFLPTMAYGHCGAHDHTSQKIESYTSMVIPNLTENQSFIPQFSGDISSKETDFFVQLRNFLFSV